MLRLVRMDASGDTVLATYDQAVSEADLSSINKMIDEAFAKGEGVFLMKDGVGSPAKTPIAPDAQGDVIFRPQIVGG